MAISAIFPKPLNLREVKLIGGILTAIESFLVPTGTGPIPTIRSVAPAGWVICAGTIGDSASGASNRANQDCHDLWVLLYNEFSNTYAPVSGGRGANAEADWLLHKTITMPDMRGRVAAGRDSMGPLGAAGVLTGYTTAGQPLGTQNNVTNFGLSGSTSGSLGVSVSGTLGVTAVAYLVCAGNANTGMGGSFPIPLNGVQIDSSGSASGSMSGGTSGALSVSVSGTPAFSLVQPTIIFNMMVKL